MVEDDPWSFGDTEEQKPDPAPRVRTIGHKFNAELDAAELDDRMRPGSTWTAYSRELSRSHVVLVSRRMCYQNRLIVIAVHLIDAEPVPLMGRVTACEYESDALYRIELELLPMPTQGPIREWVRARGKN